MAAASAIAVAVGLDVDRSHVLQNSNKLSLRLLPCDTVARVAPRHDQNAQFEVDLAQSLLQSRCPVGGLDPRVEPRVYERDGFVITFWTYHRSRPSAHVSPADYADALQKLHVGMREVTFPAPHFSDRITSALQLLDDPDRTPELSEPDRVFLTDTLRESGRKVGESDQHQLLHGEPHPGNLLATRDRLLFIDLETCCRGPVEFDLAHAPHAIGKLYPGVEKDLLRECRMLMLAMITTWRWDRDDQFPDGHRLGSEWLRLIRTAVESQDDPPDVW